MDEELKVVVTSVLEADPDASAQRIAGQLPDISQRINSKSKIKVQLELDDSTVTSEAKSYVQKVSQAAKSQRIGMPLELDRASINKMRSELKNLGVDTNISQAMLKQLDQVFVSINKTRHYVDGKEIIQDTKTEMSRRNLAIPDMVAEHIAQLIEKHHAIQYDHTDWLIQDGFGQPMNPGSLTNHITRIEKNNGLPLISVHGLRHTFASMLNSEGIDIARISAELGHSNITTTLNVYTHVFGGATASSRGIADALNKKLDASATSVPPFENKRTAEA